MEKIRVAWLIRRTTKEKNANKIKNCSLLSKLKKIFKFDKIGLVTNNSSLAKTVRNGINEMMPIRSIPAEKTRKKQT